MSELSRDFILAALDSQAVWDLSNEVLYRLCASHPRHGDAAAVLAKVLIVGRVYAAAIERRRERGESSGDVFYRRAVAEIQSSQIDVWLDSLREQPSRRWCAAVRVHKKFTDLLKTITNLEKRSLASKYLHFHLPDRFLIYDSRAERSAKQLVNRNRGAAKGHFDVDVDATYAAFVARCEQISDEVAKLIKRIPTPREVDKILVHWSEVNGAK